MLKLHWWAAGAVVGLAAAAPVAALADQAAPTPAPVNGPATVAPVEGTKVASAATTTAAAATNSADAAKADTAQAIPDDVPPAVRAYLEALQKRVKELEDKLNQGQKSVDTPKGSIPAPSGPAPIPPVPSARTLTTPLGSRLQMSGYAEFRMTNIGNATGDAITGGHDKVDFLVNRFRPRFNYFMDDHWEADIQMNMQTRSTANTAMFLNARDTYIEYHNGLNNNIALRFGQQKVPFGFEDFIQGDEPRAALERSRVTETFVPDERDLGMDFIWNIKKLPLTQAMYRGPLFAMGVFNGNGINRFDDDKSKDIAATFRMPLGGHNTIGLSGLSGTIRPTPGPGGKDFVHQAGDFDWESYWGNFTTQVELVMGRDKGHDINGGFGQVDYMLGKVGHVFAKFDWFDPSTDAPAGGSAHDYWHQSIIGWYKDFTKNVRITAQYGWVTNELNASNIHPNTFGVEFQGNF